ncbi:MAG: serine acetyltransferase [Bacteroidia bacterium]|nr:serine acetyltransferase [Bacteroidia bacterium]
MPDITIPNQKVVEKTIKSVFELLFPTTHSFTDTEIESNRKDLQDQILEILSGMTDNKEEVTRQFFNNLKNIKKVLLKDAGFILESDPAAKQLIEVIAIYPGFFAIFCYRIANSLAKSSIPLLPRMITEYAHKVTGIDIHPLAEIGSPLSIDHGTGIVIGETTIIGNNVKLYQGVTLGALSVDKKKASKKRHPTIEDNVILYAGCTILGGETVVGRNSIIGGNVWLTESIAPFSVVYHKSEIIVKNQNGFQEPINFII